MLRRITIMMFLTALRISTQAFSTTAYRQHRRVGSAPFLLQRFLSSSDTGERTEAELEAIQAERDARK